MGNWVVIIYILGAVQGIFLAGILLSRRRGATANRLLALTMLAFSIDLSAAAYHRSGLSASHPELIGIDYALTFLYGPLLYLYTRILSSKDHRFKPGYYLHFIPFACTLVIMIPFYAQTGPAKLAFLSGAEENVWAQPLGLVNHAKLIQAVTYVVLTLMLLHRHRLRIRDDFSWTEHITLTWLRNLITGIVLLAGMAVVIYLLELGENPSIVGLNPANVYDDFNLLGVAAFVYAIGFIGLRQPEIFDSRWHEFVSPSADAGAAVEFEEKAETGDAASGGAMHQPRYARSGIDEDRARSLKIHLVEIMDSEKLYRKQDLTLQDLADAVGVSTHNLTEVLNTQIGKNFYDFVNGYRVKEVAERLADPATAHLTLLSLGEDAGFNSKSSFNAVFKKHMRMTPSQYRGSLSGQGG